MNLMEKYRSRINPGTNREALRKAFDELFNRFNRKTEHCITIDMIRQYDPKAADEIMELTRQADAAWYREDLPTFRESMMRLEERYLHAVREL